MTMLRPNTTREARAGTAGAVLPIEIINDHIVVEWPGRGRALIDTGSPVTLRAGEPGPLVGLSPESLAPFVGTRLDALVGMDTLGGAPFLIDWHRRQLVLDPSLTEAPVASAPARAAQRLPVLPLSMNGRTLQVVLDTGATTSYFVRPLEALGVDGTPVGQMRDFWPGPAGIIQFDTPLHQQPVWLGAAPVTLVVGVAPQALALGLTELGVDGVIGADVFKAWRVVIDLPAGWVRLYQRTGD